MRVQRERLDVRLLRSCFFFGYHSSNDQVTCCGYLYLVRLRLYAEEDNKDKASASSAADAAAEPDFCGGEFRYPRTCGGSSDCEYTARWEYDEGSDSVKFTVKTTHTKNRWTGIGFSKDTRMVSNDARDH
jgi:hypothetical protein